MGHFIDHYSTVHCSGKHEPDGEVIEWPGDEVDDKVDYKEDTKGIPQFWYHILKNANDDLNNEVTPHDEPVLKSLLDITEEFARRTTGSGSTSTSPRTSGSPTPC